jgi:5-oxoprolinase (ATP-hydrolysing)
MFRFAIDRGGTFTDVYAELPDGSSRVLKLLSVDPANYADAPTEGIARVIEEFSRHPIDRSRPVPSHDIEWIRMGTTVATNALLERKGARFVLVTTKGALLAGKSVLLMCKNKQNKKKKKKKGFRDVLVIGDQTRSNLFDLSMRKTSVLYEEV